jgi:hypothetical protein
VRPDLGHHVAAVVPAPLSQCSVVALHAFLPSCLWPWSRREGGREWLGDSSSRVEGLDGEKGSRESSWGHFGPAHQLSPVSHPITMAFAMKSTLKAGVRAQAASRRSTVAVAATSRVNQNKSDIIVSPSILSADFSKLGDEVRRGIHGCPSHPHDAAPPLRSCAPSSSCHSLAMAPMHAVPLRLPCFLLLLASNSSLPLRQPGAAPHPHVKTFCLAPCCACMHADQGH